ncbi:unnamed protein product [Sympodiomycopsis kandeliae]
MPTNSVNRSSDTLVDDSFPPRNLRHRQSEQVLYEASFPLPPSLQPLDRQQQYDNLRQQRLLFETSTDPWHQVAEAGRRAELARQEHLILQQEHERLRLRARLNSTGARTSESVVSSSTMSSSERGQHRDSQFQTGRGNQHSARTHASRPPRDGHQVFLIDCKSCGAFLTDRGMRAVLLLKPHVTLFSTDVMPTTCGPLYPPSRTFPSTASSSEAHVERTCECLTQTLGCYGCGAQVGYHIVSPCTRCTASVTGSQRGSNGHRTVLHCGEITVRERRYVPGDPGVRCASPPPPPYPTLLSSPYRKFNSSLAAHNAVPSSTSHGRRYVADAQHLRTRAALLQHIDRTLPTAPRIAAVEAAPQVRGSNSRIVRIDPDGNSAQPLTEDMLWSLGTQPELIDMDELEVEKAEASGRMDTDDELEGDARRAHDSNARDGDFYGDAAFRSYSRYSSRNEVADDSSGRSPRMIRRGEAVFWSDLVAGGERAPPLDSDKILQMPVAGR